MKRHFSCTACGKCCTGMLPLTIADALKHADKFPLVLAWTPVRQGARSYEFTGEIGITVELKKKKRANVRIAPCAYIPPEFNCPALAVDGMCSIQDDKPLRCKAMPFSGYRDEKDQNDLLIPRPGWECDVSDAAPMVYENSSVAAREDFEAERAQLLKEAKILKPYGDWLLDCRPELRMEVQKSALKAKGGVILVDFLTLIPRLPSVDIFELAEKQYPVNERFARITQDEPSLRKYHTHYVNSAKEWRRVAQSNRHG